MKKTASVPLLILAVLAACAAADDAEPDTEHDSRSGEEGAALLVTDSMLPAKVPAGAREWIAEALNTELQVALDGRAKGDPQDVEKARNRCDCDDGGCCCTTGVGDFEVECCCTHVSCVCH